MERYSGETGEAMFESEQEELAGQAEAWKYTFAFVDALVFKSAILLGIPDIIARHGSKATLSLSQIVAELPSKNPEKDFLFRILRFLVAKNFLRAEEIDGEAELKYGLTPVSKWFLKDCAGAPLLTMTPLLLYMNHLTSAAPLHVLNECVLHRGNPYQKANGAKLWEYCARNPEFGDLLNQGMASNSKILMKALLAKYQGFRGLSSLVDVGGGIGVTIAEIVKSYPSIKGINFDEPHVIATAPALPGVKHVGGDMFKEVPSADAIFMKAVMHLWQDEDCVKILKQCRRGIPKTGKVIIMDAVLKREKTDEMDTTLGFTFDMVMLGLTEGKERSEEEWKNLLKESGFPRFNFIAIPPLLYVIEAFPY